MYLKILIKYKEKDSKEKKANKPKNSFAIRKYIIINNTSIRIVVTK